MSEEPKACGDCKQHNPCRHYGYDETGAYLYEPYCYEHEETMSSVAKPCPLFELKD